MQVRGSLPFMPLVTLTTDFGTRDSYVAELKGVLFSEGPTDLRVVDLSHELAPFDITGAALFVGVALVRFPPGSIHIVVVDPGVGSARKPLLIQARDQLLVGPDNGVFTQLLDGAEQVHVIAPEKLGSRAISATFHGRDLFAPAAARLARGALPSALGTPTRDYEKRAFPEVQRRQGALLGQVIHVDRFGNLITNVSETDLRGWFVEPLSALRVSLANHVVERFVSHYAQGNVGQLLALVGSSGLLEVSVREDSAAERLCVRPGCPVRVHL
jgi:S-adenosylmethionine hydrolase